MAPGAGWPSSAGLFLLSFIINLGHKPGQRRVPNEQLFEKPGVKPLHVIRLGFLLRISSLQERRPQMRPSSCRTC